MIEFWLGLSRVLLLATLAVAPWLVGSYPAWTQVWIVSGVAASAVACLLGCVCALFSQPYTRSVRAPWTMWVLAGLCIVGWLQTAVPMAATPVTSEWADALQDTLLEGDSPAVASIAPWLTQFQSARLGVAVLAIFLGAQLFRTPTSLAWLLAVLGLSGALLSAFGIVQSITWNDQLYWSIPLRHGGTPFASFVNRNNAAAFLNLALAGCIGGCLLAQSLGSRTSSERAAYGFILLATMNMAGLVACNSRGGLASMLLAGLALGGLLWKGSATRLWQGLAAAAVLAVGVGWWFGHDADAVARLRTLADPGSALADRWAHWVDTAPALADRPLLGSGWGTYKYANLPYQDRDTTHWYWNADNLYFELAVEGGLLGAGLVAALLVMLLCDVWAIARQGRDGVNQSLAALGGFLLVALGLQSATDFGLTLLSVGLTACVIVGAVSAQAISARRTARPVSQNAAGPSRIKSMLCLVPVAVGGICFVAEFFRTVPAVVFRESCPVDLNDPAVISPAELDSLIETGRGLATKYPDDGDLHARLADLYQLRYRFTRTEQLASGKSGRERNQAWMRTRLEALHHTSTILRDPQLFAELRNRPEIADNIPPLIEHLSRATACDPDTPYRQVLLRRFSQASPDDVREDLRRALLLAAGKPIWLLRIGQAAVLAREDELGLIAWRRALTLRPSTFSTVVELSRTAFDDDRIAASVLHTPEELIAFSSQTRSVAARDVIIERLQDTLQSRSEHPDSAATHWIRGRLIQLQGDTSGAIPSLLAAVEREPLRVEWLADLAEAYIAAGDYSSAKEQLLTARSLRPHDEKIAERLKFVRSREFR